MDWTNPPSGAGPSGPERGAPVVLRLLPYVHHPPARVLIPFVGHGLDARALDARGYRVSTLGSTATLPGVTALPGSFLDATPGTFDLVCESGGFGALAASDRPRYVAAAAAALRPGGLLFGAFPSRLGAGELFASFSGEFDVARLEPSAFGDDGGWFEAIFVRR
jgi:SAM-dependent methyltransferase